MFTLTFEGAAQTTTGSMHVVDVNGLRILLDCGLYQGSRKEAYERNRQFPIDATRIDAVLLSHAHIDHSGNLPTLARRNFKGKIHATPATRDLCDILLRDSAYIQLHDLEIVNRKRAAQGKNLFEPLYEMEDVDRIMNRFAEAPYYKTIELGNNVTARFYNAGHILGSATVEIAAKSQSGVTRRLLFTGDLGQPDQPILPDYDFVEGANILITESTYADRDHPPKADVKGRLKAFIEDIVQQKSKLVIPAFSVGRTQQILYYLNELHQERRIPQIPIFVDSPLSLKATKVYDRHRGEYDEAAQAMISRGFELFQMPGLAFLETADQSKALNTLPGPMVIIAASGMCEGGRVLHHLQNNVGDPRNIILIVGYQAENTLGRRIVERRPTLKIFGDEFPLNARVHTINALSAHADRTALRRWIGEAAKGGTLQRAFAVHGEDEKVAAMTEILHGCGIQDAIAPARGAVYKNV